MTQQNSDDDISRFELAPGFHTAAIACGLKSSGGLDLGLVWTDTPCAAAGMFTTNRVQAAPVTLDRERLQGDAASIRGVIANAGCANAVTGPRGLDDAHRMAELAADSIGARPNQILVLSTGVIGAFLDMVKIEWGVAALASPASLRHASDLARAITTTDTRPKFAACGTELGGGRYVVSGVAKGAGMIHPNMATMLSIVTTDARLDPARLDRVLRAAVERSFNRLSVDGDMSTNDTVLLLASGASGVAIDDATETGFTAVVTEVCASLARQIARDGEGATRLVELRVTGAATERQAHRVGDAIACSPLVKTAIHGGDPNWGRILAAAGYCGEAVDPGLIRLWFGADDMLNLMDSGLPVPFDRRQASALLREDPVVIRLDLGLGGAAAVVWTCDLSAEYVSINADYTT